MEFLQQRHGAAEVGDHDGAAYDQHHGEDLENWGPEDGSRLGASTTA